MVVTVNRSKKLTLSDVNSDNTYDKFTASFHEVLKNNSLQLLHNDGLF
jgi:hypothetical protein